MRCRDYLDLGRSHHRRGAHPGCEARRSLISQGKDLESHEDPASVIVDVAIDQGGCVETAKRDHPQRSGLHDQTTSIHYCVGNMPGAVARTSTQALTNATLPWVLKLADAGPDKLAAADPHFANAINMDRGTLTNQPVAEAHDLEFAGQS